MSFYSMIQPNIYKMPLHAIIRSYVMRIPLSLRIQMYLAGHPHAANRLLGLMGAGRVEAAGRQAAVKAARLAFERVPFYRQRFIDAGFTAEQMRHLTWD